MEFSISNLVAGFFRFLTSLSQRYGSGDPMFDIGMAIVVLFVLMLTVAVFGALRRAAAQSYTPPQGFEPGRGAMGRLEKLEKSLNDLRTDVARSKELSRGEMGFLRHELEELRAILEERTGAIPAPENRQERKLAAEAELLEVVEPEAAPEPKEETQPPSVEEVKVPVEEPRTLGTGLQKTREGFLGRLKSFFVGKAQLDESQLEGLEELLIGSDMGVKTTAELLDELRTEVRGGSAVDLKVLEAILKMKILRIMEQDAPLQSGVEPRAAAEGPFVVMVVGVNGAGKTTSVAKMASQWKEAGLKVLMVAADTFRAAAVDQLKTWGERVGVEVVSGAPESKPATVVFDAMTRAKAENFDVVVIDTAGRLHTRSNLMQELEGVVNTVRRHQADAPHEVLLVVDGATGQNALSQAREFNQAIKLSGIVVTKLDGTPKGGVVVAIKNELGIPLRYIGVGESASDLKPFVARDFVEALFEANGHDSASGAHAEERLRKRVTVNTEW